jgi:thioredoxin-related protein
MTPFRNWAFYPALAAVCAFAAQAEELWLTDYDEAVKKAEAEKKDLFLLFTDSSRAAGLCPKMKGEVLDSALFKQQVAPHYILVLLDFAPAGAGPSARAKEVENQYVISGYPYVMLTDAQGRNVGRAQYMAGGAEAWLKRFAAEREIRIERDKKLQEAEKAKGRDRAKLLDEALEIVWRSTTMLVGYEKEELEILSLDPRNEAGLKVKWEERRINRRIATLVNQKKLPEALAFLEEVLKADWPHSERQRFMSHRARILVRQGKIQDALAELDQALRVAPRGAEAVAIYELIDQVKALAAPKKP